MNPFPSFGAFRAFALHSLSLGTLVLLGSGCGVADPDPYADLQRDLDQAMARWARSGPEAYQMDYQRTCFCIREAVQPVEITVRRGTVESRRYLESGRPVPEELAELFPPVPQLFAVIREAILDRATEIRVAYDTTFGYPTEIYIDWRAEIADEEVGHRILRLLRLP